MELYIDRIILTDEDENDLTIEESDEDKQVNSPETINEEPGCSHCNYILLF